MAGPDVITAARFTLDVTGRGKCEFSELSGISMEIDVVEFQYNDSSGSVGLHKFPGKAKPATIALKRPMNNEMMLWKWHSELNNFDHKAMGGIDAAKNDGSLLLFDMGGQMKAHYKFLGGWPSKLGINGMKAGASEVMVEDVTITCDMLMRMPD